MQFASYVFLFYFLPGFLLLYAAIGPLTKKFVDPRRARSFVIAVASYVFYGWWRPDFVWLMMVSSLVDFVAGIQIGKQRDKGLKGRGWLLVSLATNLGLLAYFKYANFGIAAFNDMAASLGIGGVENWSPVILPIGISFFTFQTMSYTIDVYRGVVEPLPVRRLVDFLCYVSLFPQLVAGPIVRYKELETELRDRKHSLDLVYKGILLLQCGLAKKILIADPLHKVSETAFAGGALGFVDAWTGAFAFTFQLYFDFSGYSDMAIGLGLMLGFHFPVNFNSPYKSESITDFWRRWHISLSSWLRDYLYVPLGGNRSGPVRTAINLMITMLLGGFWHGANWTFLAWGAYQGLWLSLERRFGRKPFYASFPKILRVGLTFLIVVVGWVFFKSKTLSDALTHIACLTGFGPEQEIVLALPRMAILSLALGVILAFFAPNSQTLSKRDPLPWAIALQLLFLMAVAELFRKGHVPFLYTQF